MAGAAPLTAPGRNRRPDIRPTFIQIAMHPAPPKPSTRPTRTPRLPAILALTAGLGLVPPALAAPVLRCEIRQGGDEKVLEFTPVQDPYRVPSVDINSHFRFKAVVIGNAGKIDYVKLYTYYQTDQKPVLLHQVKYLNPSMPPPAVFPSPGLAPDALTGTHTLYSPELGREIQYGCALLEVAR